MITLKPFQHEGVKFLKDNKHALLADDMGLGKSVQVIRAMDAINAKKTVIVCPASVRTHWQYHIMMESDFIRVPQIIDKGTDNLSPNDTYIISYNLLITCLYKFKNMGIDLVVMDEAHYCKSLDAQRTIAVLGTNGLAKKAKYIWALTGTPIVNRPIELYPLILTLAPGSMGSHIGYYAFAKYYCGGYMGKYDFEARGATHKEELAEKLKGFMLRRTKKQVLTELAKVNKEVITIRANTNSQKVIIKEQEIGDITHYTNNFGKYASLRQELALAKMPECIEYLLQVLDQEEKLVIFAYHHSVIDQLQGALKAYNPVVYVGGMNDKAKQEAINNFKKEKEVRVFIGNIVAAGTGIDGLQTVCDTAIFVEWSWSPGEVNQAIDRLNRMGQSNPVTAQFLVVADSVEAKMIKSLLSKSKVIKSIIGD